MFAHSFIRKFQFSRGFAEGGKEIKCTVCARIVVALLLNLLFFYDVLVTIAKLVALFFSL